MSCPDCRPNWRTRLLWFGIVVTVLLALVFVEGAFGHQASPPDTGTLQENPQ